MTNTIERNINPELERLYYLIEDAVEEYCTESEEIKSLNAYLMDYEPSMWDAGPWISEDLLDYSLRGVAALKV